MSLKESFIKLRNAGAKLVKLEAEKINAVLLSLADRTEALCGEIIKANELDLAQMDKADSRYDRLLLNEKRIKGIASDIRNVAALPSPIGNVLYETVRPNGLKIKKIAVPMGVIGVIYESRPNVTFDVFSLCFKTGNACALRGGKEADFSNKVIVDIIQEVLREHGVDEHSVYLLPPSREATAEMLVARDYVDIIIPRGSQNLINFVRENARVPVIETGAGVVHVYFDKDGDVAKGKDIVYNSKTRRVSVCNSLDCLLIHHSRLNDLPKLIAGMSEKQVEIFADEESYAVLEKTYPEVLLKHATPESFGIEFLDYKMAIKTVTSLDQALAEIKQYSSQHSEAIVSENQATVEEYLKTVDAAVVYANVSTAFTDGAQFGLGAEIGISTQKMHARGPMGLDALTSYKWIVTGNGQTRG